MLKRLLGITLMRRCWKQTKMFCLSFMQIGVMHVSNLSQPTSYWVMSWGTTQMLLLLRLMLLRMNLEEVINQALILILYSIRARRRLRSPFHSQILIIEMLKLWLNSWVTIHHINDICIKNIVIFILERKPAIDIWNPAN